MRLPSSKRHGEGALFRTCASPCLTPCSARSESTAPRHRGAGSRTALSPPAGALCSASNERRKMCHSDICNRLTTRAPNRSIDFRGSMAPASRRVFRPRIEVRLTAILKLRPYRMRPFCDLVSRGRNLGRRCLRKCRAPFGPGGYCDRQPSGRHPPTAAFSAACRICDVTSDTLCRTPHACGPRPKPRTAAAARQTRSHRRLVKDDGFARARVPSTDECLANPLSRLDETRHRACDFAVAGRLPALLRLPVDPEGKGG